MASTATIVEVELHGYSDNPVYDQMCYKLARLAGAWREEKTDKIAEQYQTLLRALIILGFDEELEVQAELPEALMPVEYTSLFTE